MGDVCNFCKYGREKEDVCGKLYVNKVGGTRKIAAHRRCMQYSSNLEQYKFDHFGGFDIEEVEKELKRGKRLRCYICKTKKSREGNHTGATAGCAVPSCRKTFHYICAKESNETIAKKTFSIVDKKMVDVYRIFCSKDHENRFERKYDKEKETSSKSDSDSDALSVSDDDSVQSVSYQSKTDCLRSSASTSKESSAKDSPRTDSKEDVQFLPEKPVEQHALSPSRSTSSKYGSSVVKKDVRSNLLRKSSTSLPKRDHKKDNLTLSEENSEKEISSLSKGHSTASSSDKVNSRKRSAPEENSRGPRKTIKRTLPKKDGTTNVLSIATQAEGIPRPPKKGLDPAVPERTMKHIHHCALILTTVLNPSKEKRQALESKAREALAVQETTFWCDKLKFPDLTENHLPYVIDKIGINLCENRNQEVTACLLGGRALGAIIEEVEEVMGYFEYLDEKLRIQAHTSIQENISKKILQSGTSSCFGCVMDVEHSALILKVVDDIDPESELRSRYFERDDVVLYEWNAKSSRQFPQASEKEGGVVVKEGDAVQKEGDAVVKWLLAETSGQFVLTKKPKRVDDYRLNEFHNPCLCQLEKLSSRDRTTDSHDILWIAALKPDCHDFLEFVKQKLDSFQREGSRFYAVVDAVCYRDDKCQVFLSKLEKALAGMPCKVSIFTWKKPSSNPVSLIVLKFTDFQETTGSSRFTPVGFTTQPDTEVKSQEPATEPEMIKSSRAQSLRDRLLKRSKEAAEKIEPVLIVDEEVDITLLEDSEARINGNTCGPPISKKKKIVHWDVLPNDFQDDTTAWDDIDKQKARNKLDRIWRQRNVTDYIEAKVYDFNITDADLKSLHPTEWLTDQVIDAYLACLAKKESHKGRKVKHESIAKMNSIMEGNSQSGKVRKCPVIEYDIIIGAYHEKACAGHWNLVVIEPPSHTIYFYDPFGESPSQTRRVIANWRDYIARKPSCSKAEAKWIIKINDHAKQSDGSSCGVYCLMFAERHLRGQSLTDISKKDIIQKRKDIGTTLLQYEVCMTGCCPCCGLSVDHTEDQIQCASCERTFHPKSYCVGEAVRKSSKYLQFECKHCQQTTK